MQLSPQQFGELVAEAPCFYCGKERVLEGTTRGYFLDRIDPAKGYSYENCVACCEVCNTMKSRLSAADFLLHILKIYRNVVR